MIRILYPQVFMKKLSKLEIDLQEEAIQKTDLFKDRKNHKMLKVHKLQGKFSGCFGFSINYKFRIAFKYISKNEVLFLDIGDHDIYR